MNVEEFRDYCLSKKGVTDCLPFDETTLVFKVMGKMFALTPLESAFCFTVKTDPETGEQLREQYTGITPAFHMNKTHWITIDPEGIEGEVLRGLIDRSYELVVAGLTRKLKNELTQCED